MNLDARRPDRPAVRRSAFTLVEVLVVAVILAIMAALVTPTLTNASAPLPDSVRVLLETDMRRTSAEAVARMQPVVVVIGADRTSWWIASAASPETAFAGTKRVFGNGTLLAFQGYQLAVEINGAAASGGDVAAVTFDPLGGRDETTVRIGVVAPSQTEPDPLWTLEPRRTKFAPPGG